MDSFHLTCLIVDQERMFLDLLSSMLSLRGGLRVVAEEASASGVRTAIEDHRPDILILGLPMPEDFADETVATFHKITPSGHTIVITSRGNTEALPNELSRRSPTVLNRSSSFARLRRAVDRVLGKFAPPHPKHDESYAEKPLSAREAEIFTYIGEGMTNREIASKLDLSVHTVQAHRRRISVKLGTRRKELSHRAIAARGMFLDPVG
mgnify:CR=1 FL=1